MRILIDGYNLGRPFGFGRVASELCRALGLYPEGHEFVIAAPSRTKNDPVPDLQGVQVVQLRSSNFIEWEQRLVPKLAQKLECDVIHFPYNTCAAFTAGIPTVVTVHDLIFLQDQGSKGDLKSKAAAIYRRNVFQQCTRRAEKIISVSETTARELKQKMQMNSSVVYNTVDGFTSLPTSRTAGPRYLFHRGSTGLYRNTDRVIKAYRQLALHDSELELRIIGVPNGAEIWDVSDLSGLRFLDRATDQELANLYANAACIIAVSLEEGFCLPIIEGFGFNAPVVTSTAYPMCEIAGNGAVLADPSSVEDIVSKIAYAIGPAGSYLVSKGKDRFAQAFSSQVVARGHMLAYQDAVDRSLIKKSKFSRFKPC